MTPESSFERAFSKLVRHLRRPSEGAGQTARLARAVRKSVARKAAVVEAGLVTVDTINDPGLRGRMLARRVEAVRVAAGAPEEDLLRLARALAAEDGPVPHTDEVAVDYVIDIRPGGSAPVAPGTPREDATIRLVDDHDSVANRAPRLSDAGQPGEELDRLAAAIRDSSARGSWTDALHAAQALTRLPAQASEEHRRPLAITARRLLSADILRAFIDHALRIPEERDRVVEVLEWSGREAAEVMIDCLTETESVGPKGFLFDALGRMNDAHPMLAPLLRSPRWHEVRLGARLLGLVGTAEAIPVLETALTHSEPRVRVAVAEALECIDAPGRLEPLRQALADPAGDVRVAAARALATKPASGVVATLTRALEQEQDEDVRTAVIEALGLIDSVEAAAALGAIAGHRRKWFRRGGFTEEQRLAAVAALARAESRSALGALQSVAEESSDRVGEAAREALEGGAGPEPRDPPARG